jgi:hypothetical protein
MNGTDPAPGRAQRRTEEGLRAAYRCTPEEAREEATTRLAHRAKCRVCYVAQSVKHKCVAERRRRAAWIAGRELEVPQ